MRAGSGGTSHHVHLVHKSPRRLQHGVRDSLRSHAARQQEGRRPVTFGALGDGVDGPAYRVTMRVASTELEKLLLHGLMPGAPWTGARVFGHRM